MAWINDHQQPAVWLAHVELSLGHLTPVCVKIKVPHLSLSCAPFGVALSVYVLAVTGGLVLTVIS